MGKKQKRKHVASENIKLNKRKNIENKPLQTERASDEPVTKKVIIGAAQESMPFGHLIPLHRHCFERGARPKHI